MAVTNLTTLVLRGVTVVTGGVAVQTRRGWGYQALAQAPALVSMRHPSPGFPEPIGEPDQRRLDADDQAAAKAAPTRAGRLSRCLRAGVLGSRTSASSADRATSHEWSLVKGGSRLSALWRTGPEMAGAMTSADVLNPGSSPSSCFSLPSDGRLSRQPFAQTEKRTEITGLLPVSGTPTASTRGKGVCYT
jgi:hypothetical protein